MSDAGTAPTGAAETAAPIDSVSDETSAADFLARSGLFGELLGEEPPPREEADSGDEPDTGAQETAPTGEEEGHSEPEPETPPVPAIEPPKSWSDEEKAEFGKLPPAAQKIIAEREGERDRFVNQKATEAAEHRRALEQANAAIQQDRANYAQQLEHMIAAVLPEAQQLQNVDWRRLSAENPTEFVRLSGIRQDLQARVGAAQQELMRVRQAAAQQQQQLQAQMLQSQRDLLHQAIPEFADATKGPKLAQEIAGWLQGQGFAPEEVGQLLDHRVVQVARKAMLFDQAEAARKAAQAKTAAPTPPRVQKPGTAPETADAASRRVRDDIGRFRSSGDIKDAARLLEHIF